MYLTALKAKLCFDNTERVSNTRELATRVVLLNWRAFYGSIGAENAAVSGFWFEDGSAMFTVVKELTGIGRHFFLCLKAAGWTGYFGL